MALLHFLCSLLCLKSFLSLFREWSQIYWLTAERQVLSFQTSPWRVLWCRPGLASLTWTRECKSRLTFRLISVGTGGPSGRGSVGSSGSMGPFWDRFVEMVPPSSMFACLVFLVSLSSRLSVAIVASSVRDDLGSWLLSLQQDDSRERRPSLILFQMECAKFR